MQICDGVNAIKIIYLRAFAIFFFLLILLSHVFHWRFFNLSLLGVSLSLIAIYVLTVFVRERKRTPVLTYPVSVFFLLMLLAFASSLWSNDITFTLMASSLLVCSVLSMLIGLYTDKELSWLFIDAVIVFSLFISFVNAYEAFVINAPRPVGLLDNWNTNAAYLIFAAMLLVAKSLSAPAGRTVILGIGVSVLFFAVALTKSRGALLSALFAFLFIFYLTYKYRYSWRRMFSVIGWALLGVIVESVLRGGLVSRIADTVISSNITSGRLSLWKTTIDLYLTHPFTGNGFGAVWLVMPGERFSVDTSPIRSTHNDYLQVLAELGPVGFVLLLLFFISLLMMYQKVIKEQATHDNVSLDAMIWVAVIGVLIHSCFTYHLYQLSMLMLVGFFVGYLSRKYFSEWSDASQQAIRVAYRSRLTLIALSIFLLMCTLWFSLSLSGALFLTEAEVSSEPAVMQKKAQFATAVTPWNSAAYYQLALSLYKEVTSTTLTENDRSIRINRALRLLGRAQYLSGMDGDIRALKADLMRLDERQYNYSDITKEYDQSVQLAPYALKNRLRYVRYLIAHGDFKPAKKIIESGWGHYYKCNFSYIHDYLSLYMDVRKHLGQRVDFLTQLIARVELAQNRQYSCSGIFVNKSMLLTP